VTDLVRSDLRRGDDIDSLRAQLGELESALGERAAEIERVRIDLASFRIRYKQEVGLLHDELDELERGIAELELDEISKLLDGAEGEPASAERQASDAPPRLTSDAVRKLFRDVAKAVHPDLAQDEDARDRRHSLMIEANRAYALGDEARLRSILHAWENSPEAITGTDPESARQRLVRRIAEVELQLSAFATDLAELHDSPLWKLKVMVDEAAARGKDLVADMVRRLKRDIVAARNRLEAMRS